MSDTSDVVREAVQALEEDDLIEASGLTIALGELTACIEVLDGLGENFADVKQQVEGVLEQLRIKESIGYTWGLSNRLFRQIIKETESDTHETFKICCPGVDLQSSEVALIKKVMLQLRRETLDQQEGSSVVELFEKLFAGTDEDEHSFRDALYEILVLLKTDLELRT